MKTCYICGEKVKKGNYKHIDLAASPYAKPLFLCKKCDKHRCEHCGILLTNEYKCKRCQIIHGEYTQQSFPYCLDCFKTVGKIKIKKA